MAVTCYPSPGKKKGLKICTDFAAGCGGKVMPPGHARLEPGPAFFYGWTEHSVALIRQCMHEGRDWYYADNAYYYGRGRYFRVTRNALMHTGRGDVPGARLEALGVQFAPPVQRPEGPVVVATQSRLFYLQRLLCSREEWVRWVRAEIAARTSNEVLVCDKPEPGEVPPSVSHGPAFEQALEGAAALVTHSSSTAVHAVALGVPVCYTAASCMVEPVASMGLADLHRWVVAPLDAREQCLRVLAANQWTYDELRDGTCWEALECQRRSCEPSSVSTAAS